MIIPMENCYSKIRLKLIYVHTGVSLMKNLNNFVTKYLAYKNYVCSM